MNERVTRTTELGHPHPNAKGGNTLRRLSCVAGYVDVPTLQARCGFPELLAVNIPAPLDTSLSWYRKTTVHTIPKYIIGT